MNSICESTYFDIVCSRRSVRNYDGNVCSEQEMQHMRDVCAVLNMASSPFDEDLGT